MAKVLAHRPRYRARMSVIYYLHGDQLLLRKRPAQIRDPRTPAQRRQRLRMRVASRFLAGFRDIVALGFSPELQDNFRQVGAYQRALGHLMRGALTARGEGVTIAPERVLLAQGADNPMGRLSLRARGRVLRIGWEGRVPARCRLLLVGVWNRGGGPSARPPGLLQPRGPLDCHHAPGGLGGRHARRVGGALGRGREGALHLHARRP